VGLIARTSSPYVHEGLLFFIAVVLAGLCLVAALLLARRAPAVSMALAGAVAGGTVAFAVSAAHDRHGVPQDVGVWASVGLWAAGAISLVLTRGRPPSSFLWRTTIACLALAPFGAALLFLSVTQACPLYVTRGAGYCFYDFDMLGAWASGVTFLFVGDMIAVMALLLVSGVQARRREGVRLGDDEWARL
jgi:hypothetical protein